MWIYESGKKNSNAFVFFKKSGERFHEGHPFLFRFAMFFFKNNLWQEAIPGNERIDLDALYRARRTISPVR